MTLFSKDKPTEEEPANPRPPRPQIPPLRTFRIARINPLDPKKVEYIEMHAHHLEYGKLPNTVAGHVYVDLGVMMDVQVQRVVYNALDVQELDPATPATSAAESRLVH